MSANDSMICLVVHGRVPSKKNSKRIMRSKSGRTLVLPSKNHQEWVRGAILELKSATYGLETIKVAQHVDLVFYSPDKRKYDLTNKAESIMDALVDAGILLDDNYEVVPDLHLVHGGLDRKNPRCEIKIGISTE